MLKPIRIDTGFNTTVKGSDIKEIFEAVPCLKSFLSTFSKKAAIEYGNGQRYPNIDLIRVCTEIAPQKAIRDYIMEKHKHVATLLCVENGIDISHPSLGDESISGSKVVQGKFGIIHHFSGEKMDVGGALAIFEELGIKKVSKILCIAGKKASRSVSFSSSKGGLDRWRVSGMLCKLSKDTSMDEIMQIAGRVCGIFNLSQIQRVQQKIYASPTDLEAIRKAYWTQEDILNETCRKYGKSVEKNISSCYGSDELVKTNVYSLTSENKNDDMEEILDETNISKWKMSVSGKTKTGRTCNIVKRLTMRYNGVPMVSDDGRKVGEKEYQYEEKEEGEVEVETENDTNTYHEVPTSLSDYNQLASLITEKNTWVQFSKVCNGNTSLYKKCWIKTQRHDTVVPSNNKNSILLDKINGTIMVRHNK